MFILGLVFVLLLGLTFGSFANVLIWRLPRKVAITGRSICPKCKKQIKWFDNIPLLSFILLKGRCRNCRKKVSLRYPLVEVSTALVFLSIYLTTTFNLFFLFYLFIIATILIAIFVIDLTHGIIPDQLVFGAYGLIFSMLFLTHAPDFFNYLFCGFTAACFLLLVNLITLGKGMGLGDVKFALVGGLFFGWPLTPIWLFTAFLTGAIVGIILILLGKARFGKQIAFGPFLVVAFYLVIIWGNFLLKLYI